MKGLSAIVLAAGMGTRMKSSLAKVLHPVSGAPILLYVMDALSELRPEKVVVVVGHQADKVREILPPEVDTALQKEQLGTAHAALTGLAKLKDFEGTVLLVSGDVPRHGHTPYGIASGGATGISRFVVAELSVKKGRAIC